MDKNTRITIEQVENGFVISYAYSPSEDYRVLSDRRVFQSMRELRIFIAEHFNYRCSELYEDAAEVRPS